MGVEDDKRRARAVFDAIERSDAQAMRALVTDRYGSVFAFRGERIPELGRSAA